MSIGRLMTHLDTDAPPLYGFSRTAIYTWLETVLTVGYNLKYVNNFVREGRYITLNYAEVHGYKKGRLLEIQDSSLESLNGLLARVVDVPSATSLKIYIKDESWESYPEMSTETTMTTKVAPLGWEVVYKDLSQISFRSRREDSSKIVITVKKPTYPTHATALKTTGAICYEMDFSKDVDTETGSSIDSCLEQRVSTYGHTCQYWVLSTNTANLQDSATWSSETIRMPWTIVGDDKMFYVIMTPFIDGVYENGSYRQYTPLTYTGAYKPFRMYAFGDYEPYDTNEYLTGSSFFFTCNFYANNSNREEIPTSNSNPGEYTPFAFLNGTFNRYTYYFSEFDPIGKLTSARIVSGITVPYDSYNYSGSDYIWSAYPERVVGGVTYGSYFAYANDSGSARNSLSVFCKGVFPYVKILATNMRNFGNMKTIHHSILDTDYPTKKLFTHNIGGYSWDYNDYTGNHLFELD